MKFYCIEHETCGFFIRTNEIEDYKNGYCPWCSSFLLMYEDKEEPNWIEKSWALLEDDDSSSP